MNYYPNRDILVGIEGDLLISEEAYERIFRKTGPLIEPVRDYEQSSHELRASEYYRILDIPPVYKARILRDNIIVITQDGSVMFINERNITWKTYALEVPVIDMTLSNYHIGLIDNLGGLNVMMIDRYYDELRPYSGNPVLTDVRYIFERVKNKSDGHIIILTQDNKLILDTFVNLMKRDSPHIDIIQLEVPVIEPLDPVLLFEDGTVSKFIVGNRNVLIMTPLNDIKITSSYIDICYDIFFYLLVNSHTLLEIDTDGDSEITELSESITRLIIIDQNTYLETEGGLLLDTDNLKPITNIPVVLMNEKTTLRKRNVKSARTR